MVTLILFHGITKKSSAADEITHICLIKLLIEKKILDKIVCLNHDIQSDTSGVKIISIAQNPVYFAINKLLRVPKKLFGFGGRFFLEIIFDLLAWQHIDKTTTSLVYSSKPALPFTFKKCKQHDIKVLLRTSIAHPLFNYYLVKNEENKYGLSSSGSYSNIKRANRLTRCMHLADKLMINKVLTDDEFLMSTYRSCFEPNKLIPYKQVFVQPHDQAINVSESHDVFRFIHVAHMNMIKGTHYLLIAWKMFQDIWPNKAELLLIGALDKNLKKLLETNKLDNIPGTKFLGFQKDPFIKYNAATAFISSSLSEMGPATILEALNAGIPVITSENCGLSNLIENGYNGFTYQFNDVKRLKDLLLLFCQNTKDLEHLRQNAKKTAQSFSCDNYQDELWPIIKGLL